MWKPRLHFISYHYIYVTCLSFLGFIVMGAYANMAAIDAFLVGTSAATVTGLSTVTVNNIKLYQQLALYFVPIVANMVFINMIVVVVRLYMFERRIREFGDSSPLLLLAAMDSCVLWPSLPSAQPSCLDEDMERRVSEYPEAADRSLAGKSVDSILVAGPRSPSENPGTACEDTTNEGDGLGGNNDLVREASRESTVRTVTFTDEVMPPPSKPTALYVPPPRERDSGHPLVEVDEGSDHESARASARATEADFATTGLIRQRTRGSTSKTIERVASSLFVPAGPPSQRRKTSPRPLISLSKNLGLPHLSPYATVGRNSQFHNLTAKDREELGGIEYRSLKLLLKVLLAYYFGLHLLGAVCLLAWILHTDPKYRQVLADIAQNKVWWAFFSGQTMTNNLGFTLTPSSMIPFQDAVFPMVFMTLLAYAGNTFYPCVLRLVIWVMFKTIPRGSALREPLTYLLKHPRRCYTLLFPTTQTWALFVILLILNAIDLILFIVLDLDIHAVSKLPAGARFAAVLFQVASSRHTGTSSFNLAKLHPAIQFSLLVMMYISVFPIAMSIRASNTYEERALGVFAHEEEVENKPGRSYFVAHVKNQLAFDLWYIFLGAFCICIAEGGRLMDNDQPEFTIFAIIFEVMSAYGNCGLSLGYQTVSTSFCGVFSTFSKAVICFLMLRGRHRGMPSHIDHAIMLPSDFVSNDRRRKELTEESLSPGRQLFKMKRSHTR